MVTLEELASTLEVPLAKVREMDARAREVVGKPLSGCSAAELRLLLADAASRSADERPRCSTDE
jgi:hypothetical protein